MVELRKATVEDAQCIWEMQIKSFKSLLDKYKDYDTNPGAEALDKVIARLNHCATYFYLILKDGIIVGAIRVVDDGKTGERKRIAPIFVLPEYQGQGVAHKAIVLAEEIHGSSFWELDTILQEPGNCYLYEKMGYRQTGKTEKVDDNLTLVFYQKN